MASRTCWGASCTQPNYYLGDHLGSTSLTVDALGSKLAELRYKAWGEVRYTSGTTSTRYQFTGQYSDSYINLLWYGSRYYDPELGRFIQPDSIVPLTTQGTQAYDRFSYVSNNPVRYTDPTGHCIDGISTILCVIAAGAIIGGTVDAVIQYHETGKVNWKEVAGAAAAGATAAAVLTVLAPATLPTAFVAGGTANVVGNQVGALVEGTLNTGAGESFLENYANAGGIYNGETVTNLDNAAIDFAVGGVINAGSASLQNVVSKYFFIDDPFARSNNYNFTEFRYNGNGTYRTYQQPLAKNVTKASQAVLSQRVSDSTRDILSEYLEQRLEHKLDYMQGY